LTAVLRITTELALAVAILHCVHLFEVICGDHVSTRTGYVVIAFGIVLPPVGTALLGIQAMYSFRSRRRLYSHTKRLLEVQNGIIESLLLEANGTSALGHPRSLREIDSDFSAAALRVEQTLSFEGERWATLMERPEHEVSA